MSEWADAFFIDWQRAWNAGTEAVLEYVTDDIEYWDVTLAEPIHGRDAYAEYCDGFFRAFPEPLGNLRRLGLWPEIDSRAESVAMILGGAAVTARKALAKLPIAGRSR